MYIDYNDYLEINNLLIELQYQIQSLDMLEKIEEIARILEKAGFDD